MIRVIMVIIFNYKEISIHQPLHLIKNREEYMYLPMYYVQLTCLLYNYYLFLEFYLIWIMKNIWLIFKIFI